MAVTKTLKRAALAAAALVLLAGSALAEPAKAEKAGPPCPKIDFTAADVVRLPAGCSDLRHRGHLHPAEKNAR